VKIAIIANGEFYENSEKIKKFAETALKEADYIIACDGGLEHCYNMDITPDIIIGDLDSAPADILAEYKDVPILRFPTEKDETDLELAMDFALKKSQDILILAALGGRFDHALGNIHVLAEALKYGAKAVILDIYTRIVLIDDFCELQKSNGRMVSLLPFFSEAGRITTTGLKYPLIDENLRIGSVRGLSNEILKESAKIAIKSGLLLVVQTKEVEN